MNFIKYYFLEDYLFREVRKNFQKQRYLTPEEFFCIVIWKSNRAKTAIKRKLLKIGRLDDIIRKLTEDIYNNKGMAKLDILKSKWRFNLPMATAILTVLYPTVFTIKDVRVLRQLKMEDFNGSKKYFDEFLPKVKEASVQKRLRDKDRELWGKSFYEDLEKFIKNH